PVLHHLSPFTTSSVDVVGLAAASVDEAPPDHPLTKRSPKIVIPSEAEGPAFLFAALNARVLDALRPTHQPRLINREACRQLRHLLAHALLRSRVAHVQQDLRDPRADLLPLR